MIEKNVIPRTLRAAAGLTILEGVSGVAVAVILVVRGFGGADESITNGFATAIWFIFIAGGVLAAGIALWQGKRWGRSIAVLTQLVLILVDWTLLANSHQFVLGGIVAVVVVPCLGLLFHPATIRWVTLTETAPDSQS